MNASPQAYYLPSLGLYEGDPNMEDRLKRAYWAARGEDPAGHYDGASLLPDGRVVIIVACNGAGTGRRIEGTQEVLFAQEAATNGAV